jgi:hypothetical protein
MRVKVECPNGEVLYANIKGQFIDTRTGPKLDSLIVDDVCTRDEMIKNIKTFFETNEKETVKKYGIERVFTECLGIAPPDVPELVKIFLAAE